MWKSHSSCLLLALAFTNAHAPTLLFASHASATASVSTLHASGAVDSYGSTAYDVADTGALQLEYSESDDIKRLVLDEYSLPDLDVRLPELFEWNDVDRTYVARTGLPHETLTLALDSHAREGFRFGSARGSSAAYVSDAGSGPLFASSTATTPSFTSPAFATSGGGNIGGHAGKYSTTSSHDDPVASVTGGGPDLETGGEPDLETGDRSNPVMGDGPTLETDGGPTLHDPSSTPVPVPEPGVLGLFALGLAGLQLASRKKKRSGLAASSSLIGL